MVDEGMPGQIPERVTGKRIRVLSVDWSLTRGLYWYTLTELEEWPTGERRTIKTATGDRGWAERTAKHFGLEVPAEPEV